MRKLYLWYKNFIVKKSIIIPKGVAQVNEKKIQNTRINYKHKYTYNHGAFNIFKHNST